MLALSDVDIKTVLTFFSSRSVDVAFLVPTPTGYEKSIMDATGNVRAFLSRNGIHDFKTQLQGTRHKVMIDAYFVTKDILIKSAASVYRPETKNGDPRIWFKGLKEYCKPRNLLALVVLDGVLYVFNISDEHLRLSIGLSINTGSQICISTYGNQMIIADSSLVSSPGIVCGYGIGESILEKIYEKSNVVARELLLKLKDIYQRGYVKSVTRGDTGVGMTLEWLLGLPPSPKPNPDYKGIELKASRTNLKKQNRVNLFSQVPDWSKSNYSAMSLLDEFGYFINGRLQLYCTVEANKPNTQGLYFEVAEDENALYGMGIKEERNQKLVYWDFEMLKNRLNEKHRETFWVKASSTKHESVEMFLYEKVVHTRKPNSSQLMTYIDSGIISMDYTLSKQSNRVRDHGYLFKIKPENVSILFPAPVIYDLSK